MQDFFLNIYGVISAIATFIIGQLFDVPPVILWLAFIGSAGGVALAHPKNPWTGLALIVGGVFITGNLVPIVGHYWPDFPQKSVAFLLALIVIGYGQPINDSIRAGIPETIGAGFKALQRIINGWAGKAGGE